MRTHQPVPTLGARVKEKEELRERVTTPELLGETVPVSVHLQGIQAGRDRLAAMRTNAQLMQDDIFNKLFNGDPEFDGKPETDDV